MRGTSVVVGSLACLASLVASHGARAESCDVIAVEGVVTLRLVCPSGVRDVKLAAVRAPLPGPPQRGGEPFSRESRELARRALAASRVELQGQTVFLSGDDVRRKLLAAGLALLAPEATGAVDPPLRAAEREARGAGRGVWSHAAWQRLQAAATEIDLPAPLPMATPEPLGARAAALARGDWAERKAAFEAAVAQLSAPVREDTPAPALETGSQAAAAKPTGAPAADRQKRTRARSRRRPPPR